MSAFQSMDRGCIRRRLISIVGFNAGAAMAVPAIRPPRRWERRSRDRGSVLTSREHRPLTRNDHHIVIGMNPGEMALFRECVGTRLRFGHVSPSSTTSAPCALVACTFTRASLSA